MSTREKEREREIERVGGEEEIRVRRRKGGQQGTLRGRWEGIS